MKQNIPASAGINSIAKNAISPLKKELDRLLYNFKTDKIDHIEALILITSLINQFLNTCLAQNEKEKGNKRS